MATQPSTSLNQWFDTPTARRFIARINRGDFQLTLVRGIPCDVYRWVPTTARGLTRLNLLKKLRNQFVEAQAGGVFEDMFDDLDRRAYMALDRAQVDVADVIAAEIGRQVAA